jgi:hypothetical protein
VLVFAARWRRTIWSLTMRPTSSAFTNTLCAAYSLANTLVSAIPAARVTVVGALWARGALAPVLSTLMMRPQRRSFICGNTSRAKRICANTLRSMSACQTASVISSNFPVCEVPALLTRMSILPSAAMAAR